MEPTQLQNHTAMYYHEKSAPQREMGRNMVAMINTADVKMILDLGCGTGYLAGIISKIVEQQCRIIAIDPDISRINLAKQVNASGNIEYLVADDQSFPGCDYELIISSHVIHWIKNKEALFKRIYEKLSIGSKFLFTTLDGIPKLPPIYSRAFSRLISPGFDHYIFHVKWHSLNSKEYRTLAESAGLTVTNVLVQQIDTQLKKCTEFLEFWAGVSQGEMLNWKKMIQLLKKSSQNQVKRSLLIQCKFEHQMLYMECTKQLI